MVRCSILALLASWRSDLYLVAMSHAHRIELNLLLEVLDHAFDKASWHGPNLTGALRGVDEKLAARRLGNRKTIWEQALHAAYWKQRVINKIAAPGRLPRKGSNWPAMPETPTKQSWLADLRILHQAHQELRASVAALSEGKLDPKTKRLIHGVAFHDIYHAGQIRALRKMLSE